MISDVLSDAVSAIEGYQEKFPQYYGGFCADRINAVKLAMNELREYLDSVASFKLVYFTTTVARTREILRDGFTDLHSLGDLKGVYVGAEPLDINDGFEGDVVLVAEIPAEVFKQHEEIEDEQRAGRAIISAAVLNQYGRPKIYDHAYAGLSRREMLESIRVWEEAEKRHPKAIEMREAMEFFDEIGWLTPLKLREQPEG